MKLTVLSVGGSIIAPEKVNTEFLSKFREAIITYLEDNPDDKLIFVCGGGAPARIWQGAFKDIRGNIEPELQDWIGIRATHLNGMLMRALFSDYSADDLVTNPTVDIPFNGKILVAAGWKPGFSTDTDAVYLANKFGGKLVINLSNIEKVYTDDPRKNPEAKPIDTISWKDFRAMVGDEWVPGKNTPFDPIASKIAEENGLKVICADGRNIDNTIAILKGEKFTGTTIGA